MASLVRLQAGAELDVAGATFWYQTQRPGLGLEFLMRLDETLDRLGSAPLQFPEIGLSVRRARLHRFPYGVYFVPAPEVVVVIAVLHLHRNPDMWRQRA